MVTIMTRIFIMSTIVTRVRVGKKDSMGKPTLKDGTTMVVVTPAMMDETRYWSWSST